MVSSIASSLSPALNMKFFNETLNWAINIKVNCSFILFSRLLQIYATSWDAGLHSTGPARKARQAGQCFLVNQLHLQNLPEVGNAGVGGRSHRKVGVEACFMVLFAR